MALNLCDTNVWLAVTISGHPHHQSARSWLESLDGSEIALFCRATQQSFLRLLTQPAIMLPQNVPALTNEQAWSTYRALLEDDRIRLQEIEPDGIEEAWQELTVRRTASPKLWMDAYLAAFARAGGYRLVTADRAFRRFSELDLLLLGQQS